MNSTVRIRHEFVEFVPNELADRTLYISIPYATAVHKCLCGCGSEVVTPLSPTDWELGFDGETVSLDPSIGNWSLPCRSHYWIENNVAYAAPQWTSEEIESARTADKHLRERYLNGGDGRRKRLRHSRHKF